MNRLQFRSEQPRIDPILWMVILGVATLLSVLFLCLVSILVSRPSDGRELYPGQYSQVDPEVKHWFNNQKSPKTGLSCCSTADGDYVEEDIREGHYWIRFDRTGGQWREIPDEIVIAKPNRKGAPVVWYYYSDKYESPETLKFYCYSPGAGL